MIDKSKLIAAGLALAFSGLFGGCASVTRGTKDTLVVESDPAGAQVRLSNGQTGTTPTSFKLPRSKALTVYIEKEGYEPLTVAVNSQVSGVGAAGMAGNVLVGGLIGAGVDMATGATKDLRPNPVKAKLVPCAPLAPVPVATPASETAPAPVAPAEPVAPTEAEPVVAGL